MLAQLPQLDRSAWLAAWLQKRRRKRAAASPAPNAPVITNGDFVWNATELGMADVWISWTFDHGSFPVASMEVWVNVDDGGWTLLVSIPSTETTYYLASATDTPAIFDFQVRYRNGATIGPYSNVYRIDMFV